MSSNVTFLTADRILRGVRRDTLFQASAAFILALEPSTVTQCN